MCVGHKQGMNLYELSTLSYHVHTDCKMDYCGRGAGRCATRPVKQRPASRSSR
jgi:hypothetical protein